MSARLPAWSAWLPLLPAGFRADCPSVAGGLASAGAASWGALVGINRWRRVATGGDRWQRMETHRIRHI
ncbi:MAG: hypothetical protein EBZ51_09455 [Synechococcaceae bacterium WB9_2_112]|nr:hypothetical protein [Synechococcaceae bacterium WB9_2_112]